MPFHLVLIGDALGVPYEFHPAGQIPEPALIEFDPPTGFTRAHPGVPLGTWSDDGAHAGGGGGGNRLAPGRHPGHPGAVAQCPARPGAGAADGGPAPRPPQGLKTASRLHVMSVPATQLGPFGSFLSQPPLTSRAW